MQNHRISHYAAHGKVLHFYNPAGLYPVNRYQSLVLADEAYLAALEYAVLSGRGLRVMRAVELCCGGCAAAITLKSAGVGYVAASDISAAALEHCQLNARINDVTLDHIEHNDLRSRPEETEPFDLIICNPPCGRAELIARDIDPRLRTAIDGGEGGVDFVSALLDTARLCLRGGGRLVFAMTSTMNFVHVVQDLRRAFGKAWQLSPHSPFAHRFMHAHNEQASKVMKMAEERKILVWEEDDGWLWRLGWIIVARNEPTQASIGSNCLWLFPKITEPRAAAFYDSADYFKKLLKQTTAWKEEEEEVTANPGGDIDSQEKYCFL